jgi:D-alanine transaminase
VPTAYLNGEFLPLSETRISVMDRGFLFGDGVYEVIPVYGGRLFRLEHHLKRLQNSLDAIRISNPLGPAEWHLMLTKLVESNDAEDQAVYLQVTRGVAEKRDHAFPADVTPTLFAMSTPMAESVDIDAIPGVSAVTLEDIRWNLCNVKAITLLPNVLLRQQAIDGGGTEAILIKNGLAIEGAASNVFIVSNGLLITPPNGPSLLPGITRDLVIELAASHAIPFREADITEQQLFDAEEIWLTSSTREISPVIQLNDRVISAGKPGPLWRRMMNLYQDHKMAIRKGEAS